MMHKRILELSVTGIAAIITLVVGLALAPRLETLFFPVYANVTLKEITRTNNTIVIAAAGKKVRACGHVEVRGLSLNNGIWENSTITAVAPSKATRPTGYQNFGNWLIDPSGDKIEIYTISKCHIFWETITHLGTFTPEK